MVFLRFTLLLCFIASQFTAVAQVALPGSDSSYKKRSEEAKIYNQKRKDSLIAIVNQQADDTLKILQLIEISDLQTFDSVEATLDYAVKAKALSEKLNYKPGIARSLASIATVYQRKKNYKTAIYFFLQAIAAGEKYKHYAKEDNYYPSLLNLYFYLGDYPGAMNASMKGLQVAEKNNDVKETALYNNLLGYIYCKQGNLDESKKYYDKYLQLAHELNDSLMQGHAFSEASEVFVSQKNYRQALDYLFKAAAIYKTLITKYGGKAAGLINYSGVASARLLKVNYQIGRVYKVMDKLDSALIYSLPAVDGSKDGLSNNYDVASFYINAGDVYRRMGNYGKAVALLQQGLSISVEILHKENERDAYDYLAQIYQQQKKYDSAFLYYHKYTELKDSIVNNETKSKIAEIQGQYDVAKKDREINRQQQIRNILIGSFALLLLSLLFLYNRYRLKQKNKYQQAINRQQNELFNAIVTTQDQERKRIAQDIHDSLGSVLSAAKLKLSALEESKSLLSENQLAQYQTTLSLLDEASAELRNISHNIMPATLSKLGIVAALQNLIDKISSHSGLHLQFTAHGFEGRIEENVEISIYRIVLELINNVVKHAAANKVTLQMIKYPDYINITMEDDGSGYDYEKIAAQKKGMGLGNILSRVDYLKGTIDIDSSAGKGTTTIIDIPYTGQF